MTRSISSLRFPSANPTGTLATPGDVNGFVRPRMAPFASIGFGRATMLSGFQVFGVSHGPQVGRVDANLYLADVVDLQVGWDRPDVSLIVDTVDSRFAPVAGAETYPIGIPIAIRLYRPSPNPTAVVENDDFRCYALRDHGPHYSAYREGESIGR